ncbi:MAG: PQQ-binding-like beta-propeller repeat protein [Phycisphaera sp. RhM]|nr:PQQ-binding-like beta-propeller repeat protein [Phycisphaera sp. RhM]
MYVRQRIPSQHQLAAKTFSVVYQGVQTDDPSAYWPGWLGINRDGWVADFKPPSRWPSDLKRRWCVTVGTGYGTPLVVDDAIYQHARQGEEEVVWCLDRKTGETRWRQSHPVPFKMGGGGESHGKGPKSNAYYADGRLFTLSISGILSAWDAKTGSLLWRRDKASEFDTTHPYWGASTSPIVDQNRVIVHFGNDERGVLVAHDVETGQQLWAQGDDGAAYASPLVVEIDGVRQVVEWNHRALVGVKIDTGEKLWEQPFPHEGTNQNMPTPTFDKGRILVGGENRGLYSYRPTRDGDTWNVAERWFQDKVALDMTSAVVNDGLLFGFSHYGSGRLFCLDTETGDVLWQGPGRAGQNATFLAFPGHVVALMNHGELKIIKASRTAMDEIQSYKVAERQTWAAPVLLDDGVLIKDTTELTYWGFGDE